MTSDVKYFGPPFDDEGADVILRSSASGDAQPVNFRAHKLVLSLASPFFKQMFSLPQAAASPENSKDYCDGLPVVTMSEPSSTLEHALRFLYPMASPKVSLESIGTLLDFGQKYEIEAFDSQLKGGLQNFIKWDPVGVYAISVNHGHLDTAKLAARATCRLSSSMLNSPLINAMSAQQYQQLMITRINAGNALHDLVSGQSFYVTTLGSSKTGPAANGMRPPYGPATVPTHGKWCSACSSPDGTWVLNPTFKSYITYVRTAIQRGAGTDIIMASVDAHVPGDSVPCLSKSVHEKCAGVSKGALRVFAEALHSAAQDMCSKVEVTGIS